MLEVFNTIERVMGIEPTYPAWKAGALADVLHPHIIYLYLTGYMLSFKESPEYIF